MFVFQSNIDMKICIAQIHCHEPVATPQKKTFSFNIWNDMVFKWI